MPAPLFTEKKITLLTMGGIFETPWVGPQAVVGRAIQDAMTWKPIEIAPNVFMWDTIHMSENLVEHAISQVDGPFVLCGYDVGAHVFSNIFKKMQPGGSLEHRMADLYGAAMFGNPLREAGHTFFNGIVLPGHGIGTPAQRLSGTPELWWELAADGDIIANIGDNSAEEWMMDSYEILTAYPPLALSDPNIEDKVMELLTNPTEEVPELITAIVDVLLKHLPWATQGHHSYGNYPFITSYLPIDGDPRNSIEVVIDYFFQIARDYEGSVLGFPTFTGGDEDRFRFIVEEADPTGGPGEIVCRDLIVQKPKVLRALSGACVINFEVNPKDTSAQGIFFKPWRQWIHVEKTVQGQRIIWASGLVQPSSVDKKTGVISLEAKGFSSYPKKMPWLENWNPLACDAFEQVHKIWAHLQSYSHGNLGVTVYPAESGIIMLPGYAFDGQIMNTNFYAEFIRASDKRDCGDHIEKLARDIPFDYVEQSSWNQDRTAILRRIFLGYPKAGIQQDNLAFVLNENVIEAAPHIETQIDWVSDTIIDGWWPGTQYSNRFTNADPHRFRRVIMQDDARINSNERAAAWAKRKLTRRQTPSYWDSIIVDMGHPNAPFGTYDVGDRIWVKGPMPIIGDVVQLHKIIAIAVEEESGACEITLKAEGAFNYDPIYYQGDVTGSITVTPPSWPIITSSIDAGTVGFS